MKRIVVVRAGALGDVILTFPALSLLRDLYPEAQVTAVGHPELWKTAGDLIERAESIDNPRFAGLYSDEPGNALRCWLKGVDLVVAWTARDPRPALERA